MDARLDTATGTGLDAGLDAAVRTFRTAAWVWLATVTGLSYASIERPVGAVAGVGAALAVTLAWHRAPLGRRALLGLELAVGAALVAGDGWVFDDGRAQSFGGVWPLAAVLATAVHLGAAPAVVAGVALGAARLVGEVVVIGGDWSATRVLSVASTGVLFALAGWAAGWAAGRIRGAERVVAAAEARAEVAAELHDGVLQTLAVIQRRSDDQDLVQLARVQEADLRTYLEGPAATPAGPVDATVVLREVAADATRRFGLRVELAPVPPLPTLAPNHADAVRGAVAEALANVAKHAGVDRAVVFAERVDGTLVVAVSDQGSGFDPATASRRGLDGSIERRLGAVGGSVDIGSSPGAGTTITVHLPLPAGRPMEGSP